MTTSKLRTPVPAVASCSKAQAQPNIALVKYWGKQDPQQNIPAVGSLSVTLDALWTKTMVRFDPEMESDSFTLNGEQDPSGLRRVTACLDLLRDHAGTSSRATIVSENNFPTAAGLASSASGFAALVLAAGNALGLQATQEQYAQWARVGSGSAARSLYGGFVAMHLATIRGVTEVKTEPLLEANAWPLEVVVAITNTDKKPISSTEGMERTRLTSPYYSRWIETQNQDLEDARTAILARDFEQLGSITEQSCLKMHGLALAARPGLIYWMAATLSCLHAIRDLRARGCPVFFTVDAGPQVKAICAPHAAAEVVRTLESIQGVQRTIVSHLGPGARLV